MEEELRRKMAELILDFQTPNDNEIWDEYTLTDQILTLIREAGWRSPEEVDKMVEHRIYEMYANETYQP